MCLRTAQTWKTYHLTWKQESGVVGGTSLCHEHETLCEAFCLAHELDQVNASNLASFELLMRRMIQIEMAVSRNSKAPDFTGLSVVLSSITDGSGAVSRTGRGGAAATASTAGALRRPASIHASTSSTPAGDVCTHCSARAGWPRASP